MARYTGPVCRLCRREGKKLYLKGDRCVSGKCALDRRNTAPGQHGAATKKLKEYGKQTREKQSARRYYGVLEKQFVNYFDTILMISNRRVSPWIVYCNIYIVLLKSTIDIYHLSISNIWTVLLESEAKNNNI